MILWHLGTASVIVYVTLGRRRIDYRYILIGAVAPDVVDGVLRVVVDLRPAGRGPAHTLAAAIGITAIILLLLRGERRLATFGLGVGWLLHLVGDGMWLAPRTFLWPAFGTAFSTHPPEPYSIDLLVNPLNHLGTWGGELAGLLLLAWFVIAFDLRDRERRKLFMKDGYLRA